MVLMMTKMAMLMIFMGGVHGDALDEQLRPSDFLKSGVDFDRKKEAQAKYDKEYNRAKKNKTRYEYL